MSRAILKKTLLDLKKQMRGKRAESYMRDDDDKPTEKPVEKKPRDSADDKLEPSKGSAKPSKESSEGAPDFQDEIKKFMSKQNKGKSRVSKVIGSTFEDMALKQEPKTKGK